MKYFWALVFVGLFFSGKALGLQEIKLEIYDAVQDEVDETTINLDYGLTNAYNYTEDSKKILSGVLQSPQLFSITSDNINCLINSNGPFANTAVIPLGFRSYNTGNYTIRIKSVSNIDATCIIRLEDKVTGQMFQLQTGDYSFNMSTQQLNTSRFALHVSRPTVITTALADCNSHNGAILIDQDTTIKWNQCQLFDSQNQLVASLTNVTGQYSFSNLAAGNYSIAFIFGNQIATKQVTVTSQQVSVTIGVSTQNIVTGQEIYFSSWATNTTHYEWTFGDGTIITEIANPSMVYYVPGTYTVMLRATNDAGCEGYAYITIIVGQATGIEDNELDGVAVYATSNNAITIENNTYDKANYTVYNIAGTVLMDAPLAIGDSSIDMAQQASGIYIVTITAPQGNFSRKVVLGR